MFRCRSLHLRDNDCRETPGTISFFAVAGCGCGVLYSGAGVNAVPILFFPHPTGLSVRGERVGREWDGILYTG